MLALFGVLIILASVILGLIVLIQNPKGGGLTGSLSGFSNQLMGVKQTTDVLEKGTWIFASVVGLLCLMSPAFIPKNAGSGSKNQELLNNMNTTVPAAPKAAPATNTNITPMPGTKAPDSANK